MDLSKATFPDRFQVMLDNQRNLQEMYNGYPIEGQPMDLKIDNIKTSILALLDEVHEALGEVGWKPWATSVHINEEAFQSELIDAWHFLMNLFLYAGMDAAKVYELYMKKQQRNRERQASGYDGVTGKCPGCGRAYDDAGVKCYLEGKGVTSVRFCSSSERFITSEGIQV